MRAILLAATVVSVLGAGCADETLSEDIAYRRLLDQFDYEGQCLNEGNFSVCYQTLTLCTNGGASLDLANRPQDGTYTLHDDSIAVARFIDMDLEFDVERRVSPDLPGRHRWEIVDPIQYDCGE